MVKPRPGEKLKKLYSLFNKSDHVLIAINADPDAIASALAVKRLLWRKVCDVTISNVNAIKRPDNMAMIRLLHVKMTPIEEIRFDRYSRFILVDSQPNHHPQFSNFTADAVIDHHPKTEFSSAFSDIRPDYGATASILIEYLRSAKIKPSAKLATGLFYAIKTDTSNFQRKTTMEDVAAFQFAFRHANTHLASKIEQADLRLDFLKYFRYAIENVHIRRKRAFIHLGGVGSPDICVLIADFFMRVQSVQWSVVSAIYGEQLVIVFRNDGVRKSAGQTAMQSFGQIGSAGGHKSMARAEIPVANLPEEISMCDESKLADWIISKIEKTQKSPKTSFKKDLLGIA